MSRRYVLGGTRSNNLWAIAAHGISAFATLISFGFLGFIASVVLFMIGKNSSEITREHLANAANIQLTALPLFILAWFSMFAAAGFILVPALVITTIVFHGLGILNSMQDNQEWEPRFCIKAFR